MGRPSVTHVVRTLLEELKYLRQLIAEVTKEIRKMSKQEEYNKDAWYMVTIPGISMLSAMIFLTELERIDRFERLDKLASYVGIVPGEQSSGEREVITGITCRRNPFLRGLITECAWVAAKKDPAMIMSFKGVVQTNAKESGNSSYSKEIIEQNKICFNTSRAICASGCFIVVEMIYVRRQLRSYKIVWVTLLPPVQRSTKVGLSANCVDCVPTLN